LADYFEQIKNLRELTLKYEAEIGDLKIRNGILEKHEAENAKLYEEN